jgi:hypothetical protein
MWLGGCSNLCSQDVSTFGFEELDQGKSSARRQRSNQGKLPFMTNVLRTKNLTIQHCNFSYFAHECCYSFFTDPPLLQACDHVLFTKWTTQLHTWCAIRQEAKINNLNQESTSCELSEADHRVMMGCHNFTNLSCSGGIRLQKSKPSES